MPLTGISSGRVCLTLLSGRIKSLVDSSALGMRVCKQAKFVYAYLGLWAMVEGTHFKSFTLIKVSS